MSLRTALAALALVVVLTVPSITSGDDGVVLPMPTPQLRLTTGDGILQAPSGLRYRIPLGSHIMNPDAWSEHDLEMRRLQELEVRLSAENKSMRATAKEWQPGWKVLLGAAVVGLSGGFYLHSRL